MSTPNMAAFVQGFRPDGRVAHQWTDADTVALIGHRHDTFTSFRHDHSEPSFGDALLRFVGAGGEGPAASDWNGTDGWRGLWPGRPHLSVFAYDWMGRHFAFDWNRAPKGEPLVTLLDPADAKELQSDFTFDGFLGWLAGPDGVGALSKKLYAAWRARGGKTPNQRQCVSFKHPLILGGKQVPENLELCDLSVHLHVLQQIHAKVAQLHAKK